MAVPMPGQVVVDVTTAKVDNNEVEAEVEEEEEEEEVVVAQAVAPVAEIVAVEVVEAPPFTRTPISLEVETLMTTAVAANLPRRPALHPHLQHPRAPPVKQVGVPGACM